ncbi:hypothetical protein ILUMI_09006 [Ignelater luminosus]|uniref:Golgin subfamily A conserved domain-containing protein n=1 Tax=Ignelater luminosus TaxID=2038154 RepID=A0A8K0GGH1_IGNLU|nr:hypothetical protein ILUMI_09006 [Ignelater luminosus]
MADATKAQKLAAARKKLKEYQQKSQKPIKKVPEVEEHVGISETLSNSTHSSVNGNYDATDIVPSESVNNSNPAQVSPFHNYFNGNQQSISYQEPSNFFDSLHTNYQQKSNEDLLNVDSKKTIINSDCSEETVKMQTYFSNDENINTTVINNDEDVKSLDYPELQQNDMYDYFHKIKSVEHPSVSSEDAKKLSEYMSTQVDDDIGNLAYKEQANLIDLQDSPNQEDFNLPEHNNHQNSKEHNPVLNLNSNTESLRQLSSQITELIQDDEITTSSHTNELEKRNQELAALLDQERLELQKVHMQLQESQSRVQQLESESQQIKIDYEHRLNRELGPLQEQLQCHAQTVGILVGEKTELSTALSQNQLVTKQKITECEELQGRLKTSRSRVVDLEKELQMLKSERSKFEQNHSHEEEISIFRKELQELKEQKEEAIQDLSELREKLNVKTNENLVLQRDLQEVSHQFSLAQVKIEQITAGDILQTESQVELLTQQKLALEKQVLELSQALKTTGEERDQASALYQYYVQQLNTQVASLAGKLETMTAENESLTNREQNLVKHVGELEKHLQNMQDERINFTGNKGSSTELKKELDSTMELLHTLQIEKDKLDGVHRQVIGERDDLLREIENNKELIEKLEGNLERVQGDQPDNVKLLAAMESDKVAAARAVTQNSELKQQLEEMQQAFVRMSNDKLDLTEKLTSEEYKNKELTEKLSQVETQLHTLSDAINIKDNELTQMRETLVHQNKQILQQDQLADRLRHYEAQDSSSYALQIELQKAQDQVQMLTKENARLKQELEDVNLHDSPISINKQNTEEIPNKELEIQENDQDNKKSTIEHSDTACQTMNTEGHNLDLNILDKEVAMKHLEEKFTRTMLDIANLTEEKQRLEHIVTQLQGETDTIGEYIALYQHQRGILKQRTQEKDEQLKRLAQDREKVRTKLDALNELVKRLVLEKGVLTPEILEHHKKLNSQSHELCSEHAKIQQEIDKITQQNIKPASDNTDNKENAHVNENNNLSTETAEEIIALLAEIKSSSLIQPSDGLENFHPCPWCSGQLLTV